MGRAAGDETSSLLICPPLIVVGKLGDEEQVMSEIHLGCPPSNSGPQISYFTVSIPSRSIVNFSGDAKIRGGSNAVMSEKIYELDEDGDLILARRGDPPEHSIVFRVQHNVTSSLPRVGLQVWRAELVLADFVLHKMIDSPNFEGIVAVEIGCGTGLVGMVPAIGANTVFLTDHGGEVLGNCARNVNLNSGIFHPQASIYVRELDWNRPWPPETIDSQTTQSYNWSMADIEKLQKASLLLAADVIYSDDLTDALFNILDSIMSSCPEKVLYLALEKRYNFSMDDLDVVANGYSHFLSYIQVEQDDVDPETEERPRGFVGRVVNLDEIPQYVMDYERGDDVEMWQIRYGKPLKK